MPEGFHIKQIMHDDVFQAIKLGNFLAEASPGMNLLA
jgi:hypothetical protein